MNKAFKKWWANFDAHSEPGDDLLLSAWEAATLIAIVACQSQYSEEDTSTADAYNDGVLDSIHAIREENK